MGDPKTSTNPPDRIDTPIDGSRDSTSLAEPSNRIDGSIATKRPSRHGQQMAENVTAGSMTDGHTDPSTEGRVEILAVDQGQEDRPHLPARPSLLQTTTQRPITTATSTRPTLQAKSTTAVSSVDIQTLSFPDGTRGTFSTPASRAVSESISGVSGGQSSPSRKSSHNGSEAGGDDSASLMSFAPTSRANGDLASLLDEGLTSQSPAWRLLNSQADSVDPFETTENEDLSLLNFEHEFDDIESVDIQGGNEGQYAPGPPLTFSLTVACRGNSHAMEGKVQALLNPILSWEADIQ